MDTKTFAEIRIRSTSCCKQEGCSHTVYFQFLKLKASKRNCFTICGKKGTDEGNLSVEWENYFIMESQFVKDFV